MTSATLPSAVPDAAAIPVAPARPRLDSVDWLRGLVMVVMALDHVRDFFGDMSFDAIDAHQTTIRHFFTRWVTHFCAPTFIFLTGVGAFLYRSRGKTKPELAWFLLTRGLWLLVLELTYIRFFWTGFDLSYSFIPLGVFWSIGTSMVLMAPLVLFPDWLVISLGLAIVLGHNVFDTDSLKSFGQGNWLWILIHGPGEIVVFPLDKATGAKGLVVYTAYKIMWVGVMMAGYGFGRVLLLERGRRQRFIVGLGLTMIVAFFVVRGLNGYGDPRPWRHEPDPKVLARREQYHLEQDRATRSPTVNPPLTGATFAALSFLNCEKYPPSLDFLLMTLGPALLLLAAADRPLGRIGQIFVTFGRVPLFYYLLHVAVIIPAAVLAYILLSRSTSVSIEELQSSGGLQVPLWGVYLLWILTIFVLYFPCRSFASVKARSRSPWLSYL